MSTNILLTHALISRHVAASIEPNMLTARQPHLLIKSDPMGPFNKQKINIFVAINGEFTLFKLPIHKTIPDITDGIHDVMLFPSLNSSLISVSMSPNVFTIPSTGQ